MFDHARLGDLLELHEKSFALLRWVRGALKKGEVSFSVVHTTTDSAAAASEWILRHFQNIPAKARPDAGRIREFSQLFVAFLVSSYKLNSNALIRVPQNNCRCDYCSYLQDGQNIESRNPSRKDHQTALELKRIYLSEIAAELKLSDPTGRVSRLLSSEELATDISMATWGFELLRRSEFASQGVAVLVLWREFAWNGRFPIPDFQINAESIVEAEEKIVLALQADR